MIYLAALVAAIVAVYAGLSLLEAILDGEADLGSAVAIGGFLAVAAVVAACIPALIF